MSASLGVGGSASKNLEQAVNYTLDVCASLDASRVDNVRIHTNSLKEYMNDTIEGVLLIC
jgi:hypothetical protein